MPVPGVRAYPHLTTMGDLLVVADALDYVVGVYGPDGALRWGLEVQGMRSPLGAEERDALLGPLRRTDASRGTDWSTSARFLEDELPAISRIAFDHQGRLWVYRYRLGRAAPALADVYAADGTIEFVAAFDQEHPSGWRAVLDDALLRVRWDTEQNKVISRVRMIEGQEASR